MFTHQVFGPPAVVVSPFRLKARHWAAAEVYPGTLLSVPGPQMPVYKHAWCGADVLTLGMYLHCLLHYWGIWCYLAWCHSWRGGVWIGGEGEMGRDTETERVDTGRGTSWSHTTGLSASLELCTSSGGVGLASGTGTSVPPATTCMYTNQKCYKIYIRYMLFTGANCYIISIKQVQHASSRV